MSLDRLFAPESIALIGASADPDKLAGRPLGYLEHHGYPGDLYLVNPGRDSIDGRRCYDSVRDVPQPVDLAMVLVPAPVVPSVIEECGEAGVPFALVIASGFAEAGADDREAAVLEAARASGVRVVGPNAQGVLDLHAGVTASFSSMLRRDELTPGGVSFVTQSGAFGGALFQLTQGRGLGTSKWLSTGNEADLGTIEVLDYLVNDPTTDVIVTYLEGLNEGQRLVPIGRRAAETGTAIVAMRVGASPRGREAAASHTGSIATADAVYDAAFRQSGVTRVRSVDAFVDAVTAFSTVEPDAYPVNEVDQGVGVVSVSGGAAVLISDTADRVGLPLAAFTPRTIDSLRQAVPDYGSATNPVDATMTVVGDPEAFDAAIETIADDDNVTALIIQFGNSGDETIEDCKDMLAAVATEHTMPIATVFTGSTPVSETESELRKRGILVFEDPVRAVESIRRLADRGAFTDGPPAPEPIDLGDREPLEGGWKSVTDSLRAAGVSIVESQIVQSADAAVTAADTLGYPVALKLDPLAVEHKSDVDGVRVDLADADAVGEAFSAITEATDAAAIVQPMVDGIEVIAGIVDDPDFGPVMTVGPGGIFVELMDEFAHRTLPITETVAREMLEETPVSRLLDGPRGLPTGDRAALTDLLVGLSTAYQRFDVTELECNPILVTEDAALAVDLLVD